MTHSRSNPFFRGYQNFLLTRELMITPDVAGEVYEPCYRSLISHQESLQDWQLIGKECVYNDTHAAAINGPSSPETEALTNQGFIHTVVYSLHGENNGTSQQICDLGSAEVAQVLINQLSFETGFYSRVFEVTSAHLPDEEWDELQHLVEHADTTQLMFECFALPDSDAVGFKLIGTPWTDKHLHAIEGFGLSTLQAQQAEEGFPEEFIRVLTLAGQADVRVLIIDPNGCRLEGLPVF